MHGHRHGEKRKQGANAHSNAWQTVWPPYNLPLGRIALPPVHCACKFLACMSGTQHVEHAQHTSAQVMIVFQAESHHNSACAGHTHPLKALSYSTSVTKSL